METCIEMTYSIPWQCFVFNNCLFPLNNYNLNIFVTQEREGDPIKFVGDPIKWVGILEFSVDDHLQVTLLKTEEN